MDAVRYFNAEPMKKQIRFQKRKTFIRPSVRDDHYDECQVHGVAACVLRAGHRWYVLLLNVQWDEVRLRERVIGVFSNEVEADRAAQANAAPLVEFARHCFPTTLFGIVITPEIKEEMREQKSRKRRPEIAVTLQHCRWCGRKCGHKLSCRTKS